MHPKSAIVVGVGCLLTVVCTCASAQPLDQIGNRAAALGAFVAVADDASAVVWNPAGLISGPLFNVLLDFGQTTAEPDDDPPTATRTAGRSSSSFLSAAMLPLGISYFRARQTQLSPEAQPSVGREEGHVAVRSLFLSQLGVTVLQSIGETFTVGATAKLVRGSLASGTVSLRSWDQGFDAVEVLDSDGRTTADLDVGVLAGRGRARLGLVARNLAAPTFEAAGDRMTVARHVRVGAAWGDRWPSPPRLVVAVDADVTRVDHTVGARRDVAVGAERWFRGQTLAVRGGVRASTLGEARAVGSAGASYAVRSGIYLDVYAAMGRGDERRWGIAGRLSY